MEFGGVYIVIDRATAHRDIELVSALVHRLWPDSIIEAPESVPIKAISFAVPAGTAISEFILYENRSAYCSWEESGRTDENADRILYARLEPNRIVFVVGRRESAIGRLLVNLSTQWVDNVRSPSATPHRRWTDKSVPPSGSGRHRQLAEAAPCT